LRSNWYDALQQDDTREGRTLEVLEEHKERLDQWRFGGENTVRQAGRREVRVLLQAPTARFSGLFERGFLGGGKDVGADKIKEDHQSTVSRAG